MDNSTAASALRHQSTVHNLRLAAETRNVSTLVSVLDPGVAMAIDNGRIVPADTRIADARIVRGRAHVAQRVCTLLEHAPVEFSEHEVNGQLGLVLRHTGRVCGVVSVNVRDGLVTDLWIVLNPDKLRHWNQPSD